MLDMPTRRGREGLYILPIVVIEADFVIFVAKFRTKIASKGLFKSVYSA